jgi:hypothetical protein
MGQALNEVNEINPYPPFRVHINLLVDESTLGIGTINHAVVQEPLRVRFGWDVQRRTAQRGGREREKNEKQG